MYGSAAIALVLVLFLLVVLGVAVLVSTSSELQESHEEREARETAERRTTIKRLRDENEIEGLRNSLESKRQFAELTPLKVEAKGVNMVQRRDERLLDALLARQALTEMFQQLLGGRRTPILDGNPLNSAISAIAEEIENRKADGEETAELETALDLLRGRRS